MTRDPALGPAFGLKWNPFASELPIGSLTASAELRSFFWRIENHMVRHGGFALVEGEPGSGKSAVLRMLADRLPAGDGLRVAALAHSTSRVSDFYQQMGELFGLSMPLHNRWRTFKALREVWLEHVEATRMRPLLLVDEAQDLPTNVFAELRLLSGAEFDSRAVLSAVFAADARIRPRLRTPELLPVASRIRHRHYILPSSEDELAALLDGLLADAGNPGLMTPALKQALCMQAAGNRRALMVMGDQLLAAAAEAGRSLLDEELFLQVFGDLPKPGGAP